MKTFKQYLAESKESMEHTFLKQELANKDINVVKVDGGKVHVSADADKANKHLKNIGYKDYSAVLAK